VGVQQEWQKENSSDITGEELYAHFLAGDERALEALIRLYRPGLTLFLLDMVGDAHEAEELMIDAFAKLAAKPRRFEGRASLKTYLYTIGKNLARRHLKQRSRWDRFSSNAAQEMSSTPQADWMAELLRVEQSQQVHDALQKLTPQHRQVLLLVYFEDMSYVDVATVLGKSEGQVSSLLYRARQALKRELENEGFAYEE
jgi:RNA polymerase sigma-70 factor (ECF subfamily)